MNNQQVVGQWARQSSPHGSANAISYKGTALWSYQLCIAA